MSQKTNPSSLRISAKYKNFVSCWYSDYFYDEMISYDLQVRSYIEAVLDQSLHSQACIRIQNDYKRFFISLFLLDGRGIRESREKALRLRLSSFKKRLKRPSNAKSLNSQRGSINANLAFYNKNNLVENSLSLQGSTAKSQKNKAEMYFKNIKTFSYIKSCLQAERIQIDLHDIRDKRAQINLSSKSQVESKTDVSKSFPVLNPYYKNSTIVPKFQSCLENSINFSYLNLPERMQIDLHDARQKCVKIDLLRKSKNNSMLYPDLGLGLGLTRFSSKLSTTTFRENNARMSIATIHPIRIIQDIQNAEFLAREIVYLLQKRAAFRQVQSHILRQVTHSDIIRGIRISCSGRVGGRSKKAQKAKTQSVQWGESGLHVFSSKLDYASKSASTLFGKVGIKVWLCFK